MLQHNKKIGAIMDYSNYGKYLYNIHTGETIGIKKQEDENKSENNKTVEYNNDTWNLIGNDLDPNQEYGTVEDLSFEQLCNLFLQGNLEVDEFVKGLQSKTNPSVEDIYNGLDKDVTDIKVTQENGQVTVTFKARTWCVIGNVASNPGERAYTTYTLTCSVDASNSQTDNKEETTLSEDAMKMLVSKYTIADNDISKYFTKVSSDNGKLYGSSALSANMYKINNGMTLQELEKHLSEEYQTNLNSKFSKTTLANAGVTQTLLTKYFVENEDGTYSIKPNCTTDDGTPITSLGDICNTYNSDVKSLKEYFESYYQGFLATININSLSNSDADMILGFLTGTHYNSSDGNDYQYLKVIGEALQAKGYLSGETIKSYASNKSQSSEWKNSNEYKNIIAEVKNAVNAFASDIAKELGKTPDATDMFNYVIYNMGIEIDTSNISTQFYNQQVENPPQGWEDDIQKIIGFSGTMDNHDAKEIAFKLEDYINEGEPNSTDCYTISIIFKAADIKETDSIEEKNKKLIALFDKVEESNLYYNGTHHRDMSSGRYKPISVYELFDYLKANGYIDEHTYDQVNIDEYNSHIYDDEEFHDVVKDVVLESFVNTDTSSLVTLHNLDNSPKTGTAVTESNYKELQANGTISTKTEEEHKELCEKVLNKLISESQNIQADANMGYSDFYSNNWLKTILNAIGATDISITGSVPHSGNRGLYSDTGTLSFTLNGNKYVLPLAGYDIGLNQYKHNTSWYNSSEVEEMKQKLKQGGFPESSIDKMFKLAKSVNDKAIDGEKCYMIAYNANSIIENLYKDVNINSVEDVINFIENIDSYQKQEMTEE